MANPPHQHKTSYWQTSYNHHYGGPVESYRRDDHPFLPKDDYTTLVKLKDQALQVSKEVWRPEEVNKWGRVKDGHPLPLYQYAIGPPCRAVLFTASVLDIDLNLLGVHPEINSIKDMRFHDNFDPYRAVPVLHENDNTSEFPIEHRAIMKYLCKRFQTPRIQLYPIDEEGHRRRYKIDIILELDNRKVYPAITPWIHSWLEEETHQRQRVIPDQIREVLQELDEILSRTFFLADDAVSVADLAIFVTITQLEFIDFDFSQYPNLYAWMARVRALSVYERFDKPFRDYRTYIKGLEKNQ